MTDRPDLERPPDAVAGDESGVIVVPYRAGQASAKLLPPLLLVVLGAGFLAYRARSPDWRGASSFFDAPSKAKSSRPPPTQPPVAWGSPRRGSRRPRPRSKSRSRKRKTRWPTSVARPRRPGSGSRSSRTSRSREARKLDADPRRGRRRRLAPVVPPVVRASRSRPPRSSGGSASRPSDSANRSTRWPGSNSVRSSGWPRCTATPSATRAALPLPPMLPPPPRPDGPAQRDRPPDPPVARFRPFRDPNGRTVFRFEFQLPRAPSATNPHHPRGHGGWIEGPVGPGLTSLVGPAVPAGWRARPAEPALPEGAL